jgi:DNA-binding CsgD family transcriptional regulator
MTPCIAIIDRNTLSGIALRSILWETFGNVEIHLYTTMDRFIADSNRHFIHFFVDSDILFRYIDEFVTLKSQTTVLHEGTGSKFIKEGFNVLDLSLGEGELKNRILQMQLVSRYEQEMDEGRRRNAGNELSPREQEVLVLMVKGLINKEIAEKLGVSLPTVIFHRNNICEKLQTRSIGKLTIHAVLSGLIDINDI